MNLTLMHPQKHVRKKIMKACNYFQILHEGDVLPLLQVGKKVALMQIFFIFCSFLLDLCKTYIEIQAGKWLTQAYKSIFAYNGNEIVAFRAKKTSHQSKKK